MIMTKKQQKKLLKEANTLKLSPSKYYSASDFGVSGDWHIVTDVKGKAVEVTYNPKKHKIDREEKLAKIYIAKQIDKEDALKREKTAKAQKRLKELKEDPSSLQEEIDNKYKTYQDKVSEYKTWEEENLSVKEGGGREKLDKKKPEHAQGRIFNRTKVKALRDLYDTALMYNRLKKPDDPTDYYGEVVQAITGMPTTKAIGIEGKLIEDPSQVKSLPEGFVSERSIPAIGAGKQKRTLSDQEILDKLKLRQK